MERDLYPTSGIPIRRTVDLIPQVFKTESNKKFLAGVLDPLVQPGTLEKTVGYYGKRYGKTYNPKDVYLDSDETLRSRYQLEPGVVLRNNQGDAVGFHDYIDFKNQLKFFNNNIERDDITTDQDHYSWNPPIDWDKFVNYREYYWVPDGPPPITILGQRQTVTSTYRVRFGVTDTWIFYPDGLTNNPTITLYRGQTYRFQVNAPGEGFIIKKNYDTGSLLYKPYLPYFKGQLAVYDNKLWRAVNDIAISDQSTIDLENSNWEYLEPASQASSLDYNTGVTNNGIQNGTLTFVVPLDAPDVLYYQSATNINRFGRFIIGDVEDNTKLDVEKEILGKVNYTSSNDVTFSNGMKVRFQDSVTPAKYSKDTWIVEGVGESISLVRFQDLVAPALKTSSLEVLFDDGGFDTEPFDDATSYPETKDYVTINRSSRDSNAWSRYNRWFHRSVLEQAYRASNSDFDSPEELRAKRPIIEFNRHLKLFNHGSEAKQPVDFIDTFTKDVFSTIEGSLGYNVDGEQLFNGARLLVIADTDSLANNRIYTVNFIRHNNRTQINLVAAEDSESIIGQGVLVQRGRINQGTMFHYDGTNWVSSQKKTAVNQNPRFDVFDENEISFGDTAFYPVSTFTGSEILTYKVGKSIVDKELGFSLSYLNIDNVGDIEFNFAWDIESFTYEANRQVNQKLVRTGFCKYTNENTFVNHWIKTDRNYLQPILETIVITEAGNQFTSEAVNWRELDDASINKLLIFINGVRYTGTVNKVNNIFELENNLQVNDVVVIKLFADAEPDKGYYEIPVGLEKNPLNQEIVSFTLGQAIDHVSSALELYNDFQGLYPGASNLRDLKGYEPLAKRFLKHSGITPTVISLLCNKDVNLIKSMQFAKKSYNDFKNNFIRLADTLDYDGDNVNFVDKILETMTKVKTDRDAFFDSDMIGTGASTIKQYVVEDPLTVTFALTEKFSLSSLSRKAVYVYVNNSQLLVKKDYDFNENFGFVTILKPLQPNDVIEIREYTSTSSNFIPPTPTKLGLYKKYEPKIFLDTTYQEPVTVLQGHDGSITLSYQDFKDDLLLELEKRIYNNIKSEYNTDIFDLDQYVGSYYNSQYFSKQNIDDLLFYDFLKWIQDTNIDYLSNPYFEDNNSFTYTYSQMSDPTGFVNLPGWWRGVYKWFYDTYRPHTCPWEMLGFSEQPSWWEDEYGPAPYTRNNLILWEDLANGEIKQGSKKGVYERYKRSTLLSHIPVDGDGNLLSPFDSGLAHNFVLTNNKGFFVFGDHAPVEYAWRTSSEYPFSLITAMCLLRPFEFVIESFDRSNIKSNKIGQTVNVKTGTFTKNSDVTFPTINGNLTAGLVNYVTDFLKYKGVGYTALENILDNIDVNLSLRMSGFVDQPQQKFLLDSKNPRSTSSSIFIPPENYDTIFNVSSPITSPGYSGMIIEKTEGGFKIYGYDSYEPYFTVFEPLKTNNDPIISVGGISENFVDWNQNTQFSNGLVVRYNDEFYRALKTHTSSQEFDKSLWQRLAKLPVVGGLEVLHRRRWQAATKRVAYGTIVSTIQDVADIMLGYEQYLISLGFEFGDYDSQLEVIKNWTTSVKEFLFWTRHKWAVGAILSVSPLAAKIKLNLQVGVIDNLLDSFYDYNILKDDGNILPPEFINVARDFQTVTVETVNTEEGMYFFKCFLVLKEHVTLFADRTVFNDVLYDKPTGYRQERIKSRGFRTVDWDGDYTSPGFIFDNVNILPWQPFVNYRLGDIVNYKSYNYTSLVNQAGSESFVDANWSKLDTTPTKNLVKNFDYNVNLFEDFYNVDADGVGSSQRDLARHAIGYQTREYLQNLAEDAVTQFRLYQGFIKEKGTANSIVKIFDKISRIDADSIELNEEWAVQVGRLGGIDQIAEIEFNILKNDLQINPQPVLVIEGPKPTDVLDKYLRINQADFNKSKVPYTVNINPLKKFDGLTREAGYVKIDQVEIILKNSDELLTYDINSIEENSHIWITFAGNTWDVLRFNQSRSLIISNLEIDTANKTVSLTYDKPVNFSVGSIVGFKDLGGLNGFHKITQVSANTITVAQPTGFSDANVLDTSTIQFNTYTLMSARYLTYQSLDQETAATLSQASKLFVDNKDSQVGNWEVLEKQNIYFGKSILSYGSSDPRNVGRDVEYISTLDAVVTGMPSANVAVMFKESTNGLVVKQVIFPEYGYENYLNNSFGDSIAVSPDGVYMAVAAPRASGVPSRYKGYYSSNADYKAGDIVLFNGQLWEALNDQISTPTIPVDLTDDGSTDTLLATSNKFRDLDWRPAEIINGNLTGGQGPTNQGAVFLYRYSNNQWNFEEVILSPRMDTNEFFGSKLSISVSGNNYYMAVSAPGSLNNLGRVYLYKYLGSGSGRSQQVLTVTGTIAVSGNVITFNRDHNFVTGQVLRYFNGTVSGDNKSEATSPPPPEDNTIFYAIRIDARRIHLARNLTDAIIGAPAALDLNDFGIDGSSSHTFITNFETGWRHLENTNYRGLYDITGNSLYAVNSIVWYNNKLYKALEESTGDGSSLDLNQSWQLLDDAATQISLPSNPALVPTPSDPLDPTTDSSLEVGLVYPVITAGAIKIGEVYKIENFGNTDFQSIGYNPAADNLIFTATNTGSGTGTVRWLSYQFAEFIKDGDMFGSSLAMNRDGSILVIGAPESDGQFFSNYRGLYVSYQEYVEDDIVKRNNKYYQLTNRNTIFDSTKFDSTQKYSCTGILPELGLPWLEIETSSNVSSGKILIYKRTQEDTYRLYQTISNGNLDSISDAPAAIDINSGDNFGQSLDIDYTGTTIVVGSPRSDFTLQDQGSVYVFRTTDINSGIYRLKQKLISHETFANELFGNDVAISPATEKIVVGAKNSVYPLVVGFTGTTFDNGNTSFFTTEGTSGAVYVFERKDQSYFLAEKLNSKDIQNLESFGESVDCAGNVVAVGSPTFKNTLLQKLNNVLTIPKPPGSGLVVNLIITNGSVVGVAIDQPGSGYSVSNLNDITDYVTVLGSTKLLDDGVTFDNARIKILEVGTLGIVTKIFLSYNGNGYVPSAETVQTGMVRLFRKDTTKNSLNTIATRQDKVDIDMFDSISLYDTVDNVKLADLQIVDHYKLKILGEADQEIKFKTLYDPAVYTNASAEQEVDTVMAWFEKRVGELWWNLSTVKFIDYEQGDTAYRSGNWNQQAVGSSVDIYEWVESKYLPSKYAALADTNEGLAQGISGQPLYPDNSAYSIKTLTNPRTGETTDTKYYYWVKGKTILPKNVPSRRISAADVANYINNPLATGIQFCSPIDQDKFLFFNFDNLIEKDTASLNIQYKKNSKLLNPVHNEYQLITEGVADSLPNEELENKWIDSLVGYDRSGKTVPDTSIPFQQRYGLSVRPRQSMFIDRFNILKQTLNRINTVLETRAFAETINYTNLNLVEDIPNEILNEYDQVVETLIDLNEVGTTRVKKAVLTANIVDGEIDTIDIVDPGFGYKNAPFITIDGDGFGALASITIDSQGKVKTATVVSKGRNYTTAIVQIRYFSVLVRNDSSINGYWSIYSWDDTRRTFFRSRSQAYDTTKYWEYIDYWKEGYGPTSRIIQEISDIYKEPTLNLLTGDLIKVQNFGNGGWAVLEVTEGTGSIFENYNLVGRENGTISIKIDDLTINSGIGFDRASSFDAGLYDLNPTQELRNILRAAKEDIFLEDLRVEYNKLFFIGLRYAFVEQPYISWAFKTSFVNATHNVGSLEQKASYKNDNLDSFFDYIQEVKPYRTTVREYTSKYVGLDNTNSAVSDFDLPPYFSVLDQRTIPVAQDSNVLSQYPYKWWVDNNGYSVIEILVSNRGSGYTEPPSVVITGNGSGATGQAYISNGSVSAVRVLTQGSGYTKSPTVSLVGGNGSNTDKALAVPVLGNSTTRTLDVTVKFDRIAKQGYFTDFDLEEEFIATGVTSIFELKYAPDRDKSKITVIKNNDIVLGSEYKITLYYKTVDGYTSLRGRLTFSKTPVVGDIIKVSYTKNVELLDSINRISKYYRPTSGMKGNEPAQLMTGLDFGGVQIQGTTFDVTGGWDALPWFTDNWDSVESNSDFYYIVEESTISVTLPYVPAVGEQISVYYKPVGERIRSSIDTLGGPTNPQVLETTETPAPKTIRIDDPNWTENWDSSNVTNPNAQMPTFIGDGVTRTIEIGQYISVQAGDTLIFRKLDSDGSVTITDVNLLDTRLSGGSLSNISGAYVTASGATPEEIVVDGDKFISPDQVPAPEENVPGQVLESVSVKVYHTFPQGAAPIQNRVLLADGNTNRFAIGLTITEDNSILVYVNKIKQEKVNVDSTLDYDIDYIRNEIVFINTPAIGSVIEIISFGLGGVRLLDYQEFVTDNQTTLFLTKALYSQTESILVTLDGTAIDATYLNSIEFTDTENRTIIQLGFAPANGSVLKIVCLGTPLDTDSSNQSIVRVNQQVIYYDGSSSSFDLDRFVNLSRASAESSILVTLDGVQLKGPENTVVTYNGSNYVVAIGTDPLRFSGSITYLNIDVYINNILSTPVVDWTLNSSTNEITLNRDSLDIDDVVRISVNAFADYLIQGNDTLVLTSNILSTLENNDDSTIKNVIEVTWFSEYPSMDIITDQYAGGKVNYKLSRTPINESYVWVYLNGTRLTLNEDYKVSVQRGVVYLKAATTVADELKIVEFGNDLWSFPSAFEIYKDMLNRYQFKRYSRNEVELDLDLNYFDTTVTVTNGHLLYDPTDRFVPGVIYVNNERIEYLQKNGNILSQLRRGSTGTAIPEKHVKGSFVTDSGPTETIPYNETQHRLDFVSDGSTQLIGPLDFTPVLANRTDWYRETIPASYGACDQVEVFVAGKRLRKNPIDVWDETLGSISPAADKQVEAEFSVDGATPYLRLTSAVAAGTRITIIRRSGSTWYDKGETTATTGKTMKQNSTAITSFILQKTTIIPE